MDNSIDVSNVDLAVTVHVGRYGPVTVARSMAMAIAAAVDDDDNHIVYIGDVNLPVTVHVPRNLNDNISDDFTEIFPIQGGLIGLDRLWEDMKRCMGITVHVKQSISENGWCDGRARYFGQLIT